MVLQKILFKTNAVLLNFLFIKESWKTILHTDNNQKCFLSRVISEGSCDTEDWSNVVRQEYNTFKKNIQTENFSHCNNILQY